MAQDPTPIQKYNYERSAYRWLMANHTQLFLKAGITPKVLESASKARKAFYESGWVGAKLLVQAGQKHAFERTPFFEQAIKRGLKRDTVFKITIFSDIELDRLGILKDKTTGLYHICRHDSTARKTAQPKAQLKLPRRRLRTHHPKPMLPVPVVKQPLSVSAPTAQGPAVVVPDTDCSAGGVTSPSPPQVNQSEPFGGWAHPSSAPLQQQVLYDNLSAMIEAELQSKVHSGRRCTVTVGKSVKHVTTTARSAPRKVTRITLEFTGDRDLWPDQRVRGSDLDGYTSSEDESWLPSTKRVKLGNGGQDVGWHMSDDVCYATAVSQIHQDGPLDWIDDGQSIGCPHAGYQPQLVKHEHAESHPVSPDVSFNWPAAATLNELELDVLSMFEF